MDNEYLVNQGSANIECGNDRGRSCLKDLYPLIRIQEHPNNFIWEHEIYERMKDRMMMQTGTFIQFDGEYEKVNYFTVKV